MRLFKSQLRESDQPTEIDEAHMDACLICSLRCGDYANAFSSARGCGWASQFNLVSARSERSWARLGTEPAPDRTAPRKFREALVCVDIAFGPCRACPFLILLHFAR